MAGLRAFFESLVRIFLAVFFSTALLSCGDGSGACTSGSGCSKGTYTIGGAVSGLNAGVSVVLRDNGSDNTTVSSNSNFTFATALAAGGSYAVTVGTHPTGQTCTVSFGAGSNVSANVNNVGVSCAAATVNSLASLSTGLGKTAYGGVFQASDGNFYGTAATGGSNSAGSIFRVTPSGVLTVLFNFVNGSSGDGSYSALVQGSDGDLYGTTSSGGSSGQGTVFKINTSGTFTLLHTFAGGASDGESSYSPLLLASDGNFYGTTVYGGSSGNGTVFRMTPAGTVTVLKSFTAGESPDARLLEAADGFLYSTFPYGGANGAGGVFKISLDGTAYSLVHSFDSASEGDTPYSSLIQATDGNFYGMLYSGGTGGAGGGAVFRMTPAGVVNILHAFAGGATDGLNPDYGSLLQASDGDLYGVTSGGGASGGGVFYRLTLAGAFTLLKSFGSGAEGNVPEGPLIQGTDGKLYGVTTSAGSLGGGGVFVY